MPTFPEYHGELPDCLKLTNPRHYLLLAYWVVFRPTALKCYLYQANPEAYRYSQTGRRGVRQMLSSPAWRNAWLMSSIIALLLSFVVGVPAMALASAITGTPPTWVALALIMVVAVVVGEVMSLLLVVGAGVAAGVAFGLTLGALFGMAAMSEGVTHSIALGAVLGMMLGVALGATLGMALVVILGATLGVLLGMALGAMGGIVGVVFGMAWVFGVSRVIVYPLAFAAGSNSPRRDELTVFPLFGLDKSIAETLAHSPDTGMSLVVDTARNPFQRWAAQKGTHTHLHCSPLPIHFLYFLITGPASNEYVVAPSHSHEWRELPAMRSVLLGELDDRQLKGLPVGDGLVWRLTRPLRARQRTPLTRLAGMLYELLEEEKIIAAVKSTAPWVGASISHYRETYTGVRGYPGGDEVAGSYEAMADLDSYTSLAEVAEAPEAVRPMAAFTDPIRPGVLAVLARLGDVGAEVAVYQDATSRVSRQGALLRANAMLEDLDKRVADEVAAPEDFLLRRIIEDWRGMIADAGGQAGALQTAGPVANPYVLNNPVKADLFVGREDILRRLEELWSSEGQCPSVVLYGHRRMGKTSILHNLGARFGANKRVVDFNMQRVGLVGSTGELLYNLALALRDALPPDAQRAVGEPTEEAFTAHNPYTAFDRFLRRADAHRNGLRFIVTVDEFEQIEQGIRDGVLDPRLLDYWRGVIQTYPWFVMAFAGLHTLGEMTEDYWHPLFGSVTSIPVGFLSPGAARRLITEPFPDFPIDYDEDAIAHIVALTNRQPYLVQLICHGLVSRFNRQTFEEGASPERRFSLADVEAVIGAPEFFRDGSAYFAGVWAQAEADWTPGQPAALRALAQSEAGMAAADVAARAGLPEDAARAALDALKRHEIVAEEAGVWRFTVELMRRWVAETKARPGV